MHPLPFAPPALSDAAPARQAARAAQQSDLAFANIYLLRRKYQTVLALENGVLYRHFSGHPRLQGYAFPCGAADPAPALQRIEQDAFLRQRPFQFCLLLQHEVELLEALYPARFRFHSDPGDADYLYSRSALAELPGARFHRKRNHIARFVREFPTWNVAPLAPENAADALSVASAWLAAAGAVAGAPSPALLHEFEAVSQALSLIRELELRGAVLYVAGEPVAMSVASLISPSVADVHYEKCLPAFRQAYPLINRSLAAMLPCTLINREEDLNEPGLRQAKLSYFPSLVLSKFSALPC